jgi:hypothetical protein
MNIAMGRHIIAIISAKISIVAVTILIFIIACLAVIKTIIGDQAHGFDFVIFNVNIAVVIVIPITLAVISSGRAVF